MKLRTNFLTRLQPWHRFVFILLTLVTLFFISCGEDKKIPETDMVDTREEIDQKAGVFISEFVNKAMTDSGRVYDSFYIHQPDLVNFVYRKRGFTTLWSDKDSLFPMADSALLFIKNGRENGLYPQNYHFSALDSIRQAFALDSASKSARRDALLWARADLLFTDALLSVFHDIKIGRLPSDSITLRVDSLLTPDMLTDQFDFFLRGKSLKNIVTQLEPHLRGYQELKAGIPAFLSQANFDRDKTMIPYPVRDSADFKNKLFIRMKEEGILPDTALFEGMSQLTNAIKQYQKNSGLTDDGKIGMQTAKRMNSSDNDKFLQLAITLDRFKLLPEEMPDKYIWVNIPAYKLELVENHEVKLESKVVVGKPITRTPVLNSAVSQMITYPQWTIPTSIIVKEILPGLKRDPEYLDKKGYSLVSNDGEDVNPYEIDWSKYSKGIPYRVVQGSGDANALGVMKFNFYNKYSVYLHDTNQRFYFSRAERALSHGCVRVQLWKQLSDYILRNDSMQAVSSSSRNYMPSDSVNKWLAVKEKHIIPVRNRIPLYIRYFTCASEEGSIAFYDDIYNEDSLLKKYYISGK